MRITVHAGHAPDGGVGCGAVGILKESTEARRIAAALMNRLADAGMEVREVTVNENMSASDVLRKLKERMNSKDYDLHISIHLNSAADKSANGAEAYIYPTNTYTKKIGENFCSEMTKIGYKNRGVKDGSTLYIIRNTQAPCILFECGFVGSELDCRLYDSERIAQAIMNAVVGTTTDSTEEDKPVFEEKPAEGTRLYTVQVGAYESYDNAVKAKELAKARGYSSAFIKEVTL